LRPGSFGAQIYDAADAGEIPLEDAPLVLRSFLSAGLDTTMSALGTMFHCLATHPQQWQLLRNISSTLIRPTFDEVVRFDPPVWALFCTVLKDTEYAGITIGEHEKVLLLIGSANRDEARWSNPDSFEITRKTSGHLGFGTGIHGCGTFSGGDLGGGKLKATFKSFRARAISVLELNEQSQILACTEYYDRSTMPIGDETPFDHLPWPHKTWPKRSVRRW